MGVDIYMQWEGVDEDAQCTGFVTSGEVDYLRGAYFGGYSDVLRYLFDWMDWDEEAPFNPDAFESRLNALKADSGERPGKGVWDHTKGEEGWDLSDRQNTPVDPDEIHEYEKFLALGRRLKQQGKNPTVYISY